MSESPRGASPAANNGTSTPPLDDPSKQDTSHSNDDDNSIKVCVRVRPFNKREKGEKCIVTMPNKTTCRIYEDATSCLTFNFDRCYWSHSTDIKDNPGNAFADQQDLMSELGMELLHNALNGYNDCLFAYGQTGSGKTWSVIGGKDMETEGGLLPRMVFEIFKLMTQKHSQDSEWTFQCRVSYLEIYNDKLRDLLQPNQGPGAQEANGGKGLEVRQHPNLGIYVPGLIESATTSPEEVMRLMDFGLKQRSVAATSMNDRSSRSHCVFAFYLLQLKGKPEKPNTMLRSKVNLVDLAGSERQKKTNAAGERLREGAQINQSLTTLALVIHALAKNTKNKSGGEGKGADFIPFRNSKLTFLLQESLQGNSKTVMIAALSPAKSNFEETISTLRFASRVKKITTKAVVNRESHASYTEVIKDLKAEIARLKDESGGGGGGGGGNHGGGGGGVASLPPETQEQMTLLNDLLKKYGSNFAEEVESANQMQQMRQQALQNMGLSGEGMATALSMNASTPYLINLAEDPSLTGCLAYFIPINEDIIVGSDPDCTITLKGLGINKVMCQLINFNHTRVHVKPIPDSEGHYGRLCRNGRTIGGIPCTLENRDRFMVGRSFIFKLVIPLMAQLARAEMQQQQQQGTGGQLQMNANGEYVQGNGQGGGMGNTYYNGYPETTVLSDHLSEIMDQQSEDYISAKTFVENISYRIGEEAAGSFLSAFAQALPLLHEANDIAQELRKQDNLIMRLDVVYDILAYESSEPMLCVRLWKKENAQAKLRRVFKRVLQNTKINRHVHSIAAYLTGADVDISDVYTDAVIENHRCQLLGVWSWRSFLVRLSGMREAYHDFIQTGQIPNWSHDLDPWGETSYLDVRHRVTVGSFQQEGGSNSNGEDYRSLVESLRTRLALVERELIAERMANKQNNNSGKNNQALQYNEDANDHNNRPKGGFGGGGNSNNSGRPQEAKMLATELLGALKNMKQELHSWK